VRQMHDLDGQYVPMLPSYSNCIVLSYWVMIKVMITIVMKAFCLL